MTYITQLTWRKAMFGSRILTLVLAGFVLVVLQSSTVHAQWSNGTNINNTNNGTVSIGTTSPGGDKLIIAGNTVGGNITTHTQLHSTYNTQNNVIMELGYGTATSADTPLPSLVLSKNLTGANNLLGALQFANRNIADGSEKRLAQIAAWTNGATNSGALLFSTTSAGSFAERMRITAAGNVGIGTASPGTSLDVAGNIVTLGSESGTTGRGNNTTKLARIVMSPFASASMPFALFGAATTSTANIAAFGGEVGGMAAATQIDFVTAATNNVDTGTVRMTVNSAGNVGIGTTSPGAKLHVNAGGTSALLLGADTGAPTYNVVSLNGSVTDAGHLGLAGGGGTDKTLYVDTPTGGAFNFRVNTSSKVIIDTSGNLGIGTASPAYKLDVQGGGLNASGGLCIAGDCKTAWSQVGGSSQWTTVGSNIYYNSGNVGIGTTSPSAGLDIQTPITAITAYGVRLQQALTAGSNNAELNGLYINTTFVDGLAVGVRHNALVTGAGNVGIGTSATSAGLDVQNVGIAASGITFGTRVQQVLPSAGNNAVSTAVYVNPTFSDGLAVGVRHNGLVVASGNVGIGTSATSAGLDVQNVGIPDSGSTFGTRVQQVLPSAGNNAVSTAVYINPTFSDGQAIGVRHNGLVVASGDVGIGTSTPSTKLHVVGDGTITGNLTVTGNIAAKYQDVAEWVQSSQELLTGTVVVLDQTRSNQVIASSQAYDTRVAGVISSQPGITLGEKGEGKVLVATTGRVKIKVDASRGSIQVGDLLVTSDVAGVAMKSQPINVGGVQLHRPGTLIGKALEPLEKGVGEILVLLSLQ